MIDDPDILRAAKVLIYRHGDDAEIRAIERIDELTEDGELGGAAAWRAILHAIKELRRSSEPVN
jgi:hypothetical protein